MNGGKAAEQDVHTLYFVLPRTAKQRPLAVADMESRLVY
jgi:hypothetical protein